MGTAKIGLKMFEADIMEATDLRFYLLLRNCVAHYDANI